MSLVKTEENIKYIKDSFEKNFSKNLNLLRISAPLFVLKESGLNDNLNGVEKPVNFLIDENELEIVHSLAKWKRYTLYRYDLENKYNGIYTDMNAIRKSETPDELHSFYVDQWDWEMIIDEQERNLDFFKSIVKKVVLSIYETQEQIISKNPDLNRYITKDVYFITAQELKDLYPDLTPKERENEICKKHQVVCIMQIGKILNDNTIHDNRSPDYDDWELNGDILINYPPLNQAVELSSMGIRVNAISLKKQLEIMEKEDYLKYDYHQKIINNELPLTLGGGIGQSRLCLVLLNKKHIGEVQVSYWPNENDLTKYTIL